jgi:heterodisulfide reductase subunit C
VAPLLARQVAKRLGGFEMHALNVTEPAAPTLPRTDHYQDRSGCIRVNSESRRRINRSAHAEMDLCWTCATCDNECPVNRATHRLSPRKIVRMASFGLMDELMTLPDLWYCISCRKCNHVCPSLVKPADLIRFLRGEAIRQGHLKGEAYEKYCHFFSRFQRVRYHTVSQCMDGGMETLSEEKWYEWLNNPVKGRTEPIVVERRLHRSHGLNQVANKTGTALCYTCSQCSNACPIKRERTLFDPQWIVRMVHLRQAEEILASPAIWLCIGCRRCTEACGARVEVHDVIQHLRDLAVEKGIVNPNLTYHLEEAYKKIYPRYIQEIDTIFKDASVHESMVKR